METSPCDADSVKRDEIPEHLVVHHARSGCLRCKGLLIEQNADMLRSFVNRITFGSQDRDDLFQQTVCRALERLEQFRGDSNFVTWVCSIALNELRQSLRKQKRRVVVPFDSQAIDSSPDQMTESPLDLCCREEAESSVRRAVTGLPPFYRSVIELRDLDELSIVEAAKVLRVSRSAVKSRLFRARKLLAQVPALRFRRGCRIGVSAH